MVYLTMSMMVVMQSSLNQILSWKPMQGMNNHSMRNNLMEVMIIQMMILTMTSSLTLIISKKVRTPKVSLFYVMMKMQLLLIKHLMKSLGKPIGDNPIGLKKNMVLKQVSSWIYRNTLIRSKSLHIHNQKSLQECCMNQNKIKTIEPMNLLIYLQFSLL